MMETPQRELNDYVAEISEHADARAGSPLPFGIQETGGGVNFATCAKPASFGLQSDKGVAHEAS